MVEWSIYTPYSMLFYSSQGLGSCKWSPQYAITGRQMETRCEDRTLSVLRVFRGRVPQTGYGEHGVGDSRQVYYGAGSINRMNE
jgi:hypothetical protein